MEASLPWMLKLLRCQGSRCEKQWTKPLECIGRWVSVSSSPSSSRTIQRNNPPPHSSKKKKKRKSLILKSSIKKERFGGHVWRKLTEVTYGRHVTHIAWHIHVVGVDALLNRWVVSSELLLDCSLDPTGLECHCPCFSLLLVVLCKK